MFLTGLIVGLLVWQGLTTVIALLGKETNEKFFIILCGVWVLPIACYGKIKKIIQKQYYKRKYVLITFMEGKKQHLSYERKLLKIKYLDRFNLSNKKEFWVKVSTNSYLPLNKSDVIKEEEIKNYKKFLRGN